MNEVPYLVLRSICMRSNNACTLINLWLYLKKKIDPDFHPRFSIVSYVGFKDRFVSSFLLLYYPSYSLKIMRNSSTTPPSCWTWTFFQFTKRKLSYLGCRTPMPFRQMRNSMGLHFFKDISLKSPCSEIKLHFFVTRKLLWSGAYLG